MKQKLAIHQLRTLTRLRRKGDSTLSNAESKIITMQDSFLTPGVHCISVPNHQHGRSLLRVCLDSLAIYSDVGMLTMDVRRSPEQYRDLYAELTEYHALSLDNGHLEDYFLSSFSCDFLIIEYTQELMEQPWFGRFEYLLHEYSIACSMPVIMLLYDEQTLAERSSH